MVKPNTDPVGNGAPPPASATLSKRNNEPVSSERDMIQIHGQGALREIYSGSRKAQ